MSAVPTAAEAAAYAWPQSTGRKPEHGDLDAIAVADLRLDMGDAPDDCWEDAALFRDQKARKDLRRFGVFTQAAPGRDCQSCPALKAEHDEYGALRTGCPVPHWRLVTTTGVRR